MTETKKENEREIVLAILIEVLEKNQFSHIVIRQALDKYSYLPQKDRSFIARLSRGCVERKIELDAIIDKAASVKASKQKPVIRNILRMAAYQLKYMDVPEHAVCSEAVNLAAKKGFWSLKDLSMLLRERWQYSFQHLTGAISHLSIILFRSGFMISCLAGIQKRR